ncbi:MAG: glycoside hydrolase family 38 C-terminal domain-containing protein [Paludibacter sp.]|nr:glycoside hydrolase family 38 C-terminal domain-containing protein [Paludibacter sp.]
MNFRNFNSRKYLRLKERIKALSFALLVLLPEITLTAQQYEPLILTGFNADVICNSSDCSGSGTLDGEWFYYSADKKSEGAIPQTIVSKYGVEYVLNSFDENNVLTIGSNGASSGELTLTTPKAAKELWLLGMSASGKKDIDVVVKYTDNSASETQSISFPDWYQTSGNTVSYYGLGRVKSSSTYDDRFEFGLFERVIPVDSTKTVASIEFSYTGTDKTYTSIFAISAYSGGARMSDNNLYMIANAHFDTQWDWDVQTSIDQYVKNTLVDNFNLFDKFPDYVFNFEGAIKYMFAKEYYPDLYERLKGYVASGQWHISGSSIDANDVMVPSAESIIRNLLLGEKFYEKEFGVNGGNDIMLPDCFGFPYSLPTLAKYCGIVGFHSQKLSWGSAYGYSDFPNYGLWRGVDGSEILAIYKPGAYVNKYKENLSYNNDILSELVSNKTDLGAAKTVRYYGTGDRGGSVDEETVDWLEKSLASSGPVHVNSVTPDQFFESVSSDERSKLPVWDNELPMSTHGAGCYTSHTIIKYWNRKDELLADATEKSSVVANWLGGLSYQSQTIHDSWVRLLWHQFHDDLTGTSIPKAYTFTTNDHVAVQLDLAKTLNNASGAVALQMNTQVQGTPIVVFNPLSVQRKDIVEAKISVASEPETISVYDPDGNVVPTQIIKYENGTLTFIFKANVSSLGYATYDLHLNDDASAALSSSLVTTDHTIENNSYILKVNKNGDIYSIIDKKQNNKELLESPVRLAMLLDKPGYWASWEVSWGDVIRDPFAYVDENVEMSVAEAGPLRSALKITRSKDGSQFVQFIRMTSGVNEDRIDVVNEVDWQSKETLLKAVFPLSATNEKATFDLSIGAIERGNRVSNLYEVAGHQWADLTDSGESYGVSILNDCKYGWDKPDDNTLRLTLIHTPRVESDRPYQKYQDLGLNKFTYSIYRHFGVWSDSTQWQAAKLNQPLYAYESPKHDGNLGKTFGFVSLNTDKVAIKALKKAEESDETIVRVYELTGNDQSNVEMTFPTNIVSARAVDGREDSIDDAVSFNGNKLTFSIARFHPKSFAVKLSALSTTDAQKPVSTPVSLTYNIDVMSNDFLKKDGKFADSNYAYPAELFSDEINADGINFTVGPRGNGLLNAVQCTGQEISIPQAATNKKLYILAASQNIEGSDVDFKIDGTAYPVRVEYLADNVGEWGTVYGSRKYKKENIAFMATHRHNVVTNANDSYAYLYIFKYAIPIATDAAKLTLPNDPDVVVFAVTVSDNENDDVIPVTTVENLPDFDYLEPESEAAPCGEILIPTLVTASGSTDAYERPAMAADNNPYSKWCDEGSSGKYLIYGFNEPVQICQWNVVHAGIESDDNIASDFTLQYYNGSWVDVDAVTGNTDNKTVRTVTPFTAERVRLKIIKPTQGSSTIARIYSFDLYGSRSTTGVTTVKSDEKSTVENFPNPFSRQTTIQCNLIENADRLFLDVYNVAGALVSHDAFDATQGVNNLVWYNTSGQAGAYIYKVSAKSGNKLSLIGTGKMFVVNY